MLLWCNGWATTAGYCASPTKVTLSAFALPGAHVRVSACQLTPSHTGNDGCQEALLQHTSWPGYLNICYVFHTSCWKSLHTR
jgi:hypothetical protein